MTTDTLTLTGPQIMAMVQEAKLIIDALNRSNALTDPGNPAAEPHVRAARAWLAAATPHLTATSGHPQYGMTASRGHAEAEPQTATPALLAAAHDALTRILASLR